MVFNVSIIKSTKLKCNNKYLTNLVQVILPYQVSIESVSRNCLQLPITIVIMSGNRGRFWHTWLTKYIKVNEINVLYFNLINKTAKDLNQNIYNDYCTFWFSLLLS